MNHYAQALAELQLQPDHELKQIGDQWQTPKALAWGLFHQFAPTLGPVVLDMFADDCNALVPNYYDAEDNALIQELAADLRRLGGAAFGNPPYSRPCADGEGNPITGMEAILNYCREQRAQGAKIMLLIKAATSETWWPEDADFIQFISGRIGFEVPNWYVPRDPKKDKPSASGFASAVVIFDASWQGERRPEARLRRDDLITTGQIILDMIHRQAVELTLAAKRVIDAGDMVAQELLPSAEPYREIIVAKTKSGQWSVRHLVGGEEIGGIGGCGSCAEAISAAAECGWKLDKLTVIESVHAQAAATPSPHPDYVDADRIMAKQLECNDLGEEQQAMVRGYVQGWLDEPYPLSEIFYRLDLAVANLLAGKPIHQGFVAEDSRSPALPHWQRHPAVKGVIYQIDDADILTPAKTAELAAWIIDNLTAPGDLLEQATAKAAELLAQSAAPASAEPVQSELQLELLAGSEPEPDTHQQDEAPNIKPLEDWAFDYQNDELNLGGAEWSCFVTVLTVLYGAKEHYTAREVAIAISVSDEQLMDEYTTLDEETKALLRKTVSTLKQVEGYNFTEAFTMLDLHRQEAVIALLNALHNEPTLSPVTQKSVMINAITRVNEVMA
ncbi:phage N-6-adenine-methyltransferase [Aeromonas media]|uniref:phage N-6-adenine-methyltransferase n=1 Tax=Aeromonas media TaxID=651 RepID=UPI002954D7B8|nr:phage N-6-adenine-methyltransferase [Aeromonas media]WOQ12559.1 phage N-6-adenine-methyltransferase [Aeromonas media]